MLKSLKMQSLLVVLSLLSGFGLGCILVRNEIREYPIPDPIDPTQKYFATVQLVPRSEQWESALTGICFSLAVYAFLTAWFIAFRPGWKERWPLKVGVIGSLLGAALTVQFSTWFAYMAYLGEIRDWGKTHDSFDLDEYFAETLSMGLVFGGFVGIPVIFCSVWIAVVAWFVRAVIRRRRKESASDTS